MSTRNTLCKKGKKLKTQAAHDVGKPKTKITKVEITHDTITGRGGLNLLVKYCEAIGIYGLLFSRFEGLRRSGKGAPILALFKQILCFFFDGTSSHINHFDHMKLDEGYAGIIETDPSEMVSSHQVKRFFSSFSKVCGIPFRWILKRLFLWRLEIEKPPLLIFMIDTMVMDNDDALKREGVSPTYKKKKGFQPLHLIWNGKIIDALFRGGKTSGNRGRCVITTITNMVMLVRKHYSQSVPIIIRMDSGFFDIKIFHALDQLGVGFICSGKMYQGVKDHMDQCSGDWSTYDNGHQAWDYKEFGFRCDTWDTFYRAYYTRLAQKGLQFLLEFARPDNVIVTNLGVCPAVTQSLINAGYGYLLAGEEIIKHHHQRGADELPHRSLKDFADQKLPFQRFNANTAWYYCMVISLFIFECFKEDILGDVVEIGSYPTTVRRRVIDIAAKLVKTGGSIILKITQAVMDRLHFILLWNTCQRPPMVIPQPIV